MSQTNFLIGRGELLTHIIKAPKRGGEKIKVYTLLEAKDRLKSQFSETALTLNNLPKEACPNDFGVARLALNPSYIAKSYFPAALLRATGLQSVGSHAVKLTPDKWSKKGFPRECSTTELFVAGKRDAFQNLQDWIEELEPESSEAIDLTHIERVSSITAVDRVKTYQSKKENFFEVAIHLLPSEDPSFIYTSFEEFAKRFEVKVYADLGFRAGNIWFVPIEGIRSDYSGPHHSRYS